MRDLSEKNIFSNGVYRSGSTLIWNILNHIKNKVNFSCKEIYKLHHDQWLEKLNFNYDISFCTIRDVRDCAGSMIRKLNIHFSELNKVREVDLDGFILRNIEHHSKIKLARQKGCEIYFLRYESDILKPSKSAKFINSILDINFKEEDYEEIDTLFSLESQKRIVEKLTCKQECPETKYWKNHIGGGNTKYTDYFSYENLKPETIEKLEYWLYENNYC